MNGTAPYPRREGTTYVNQLYAVVRHQQALFITTANKKVLAFWEVSDFKRCEAQRSLFSDSLPANSVK